MRSIDQAPQITHQPPSRRWPKMGGRYGASSDGSSEYQSRRPNTSQREREQQTIAEAVRAVKQRQTDKETTNTSGEYQRSASRGGDSGRSINLGAAADRLVSSVITADEAVADLVAEQLIEQIRKANEEEIEELIEDGRY